MFRRSGYRFADKNMRQSKVMGRRSAETIGGLVLRSGVATLPVFAHTASGAVGGIYPATGVDDPV